MQILPAPLYCLPLLACVAGQQQVQPLALGDARLNVVLVMTDDQGFGDFGFAGNPVISTPNLDAMAGRSARMESFYVSPVCTPTRASLMTGRWSQRTRAIDTYIGRAMLEPEERTVAEYLRDAGWGTGIFGKWHLGDCYPMRAMDQGFQESLVHRGGGIGQPSDPLGAEADYTDAVLFKNGEAVSTSGYCTDVYFDAAIEFMRERRAANQPFFAYVATNAPHGPFGDVPEDLYQEYLQADLSPGAFPASVGHPLPAKNNADKLARIFAMIENIDQNMGKLFAALEDMDVLDNTLVLFMVDNGPNTQRYVTGMRGMKSHVHEGGVRSPLLAHWPGRLAAGHGSDRISAHVDVLPTILDACDVSLPKDAALDGRSLLPLLEGRAEPWPDRQLVIQAHRGDEALRGRHFMLRTQRWKLLCPSGFGGRNAQQPLELYDMLADPLEQRDRAGDFPEVVSDLQRAYNVWFDDVSSTRPDNYAPPRIHIGHPTVPRTILTRQDWRLDTDDSGWTPNSRGHWQVEILNAGPYEVAVQPMARSKPLRVQLQVSSKSGQTLWDLSSRAEDPAGETFRYRLSGLKLPVGPASIEVLVEVASDKAEAKIIGAYQVRISSL
jgi:arylsulfatase/arylsulfatase A